MPFEQESDFDPEPGDSPEKDKSADPEAIRQQAERAFRTVLQMEARWEEGDQITAESGLREAISLLEREQAGSSELSYAYLILGKVLADDDQLQEAEAWLRKAAEFAEAIPLSRIECLDICYELTKVLEAQGESEKAFFWKNRAHELQEAWLDEYRPDRRRSSE